MSWIPKTGRFLAVGLAGIGTSAAAWNFYSEKSSDNLQKVSNVWPLGKVSASWTTNSKPSVTWDDNWDKRQPQFLVKPAKGSDTKDEKDRENELLKVKPKATRHLFLIRHGQYDMEPDKDIGRKLSALGREQADLTGQRLKELGKPYTILVNSTMTRATETADIIAKHFPELPRESSDLLREGAPIPPEPPVGHWRPEYYTSVLVPCCAFCVSTNFVHAKKKVEPTSTEGPQFHEDGSRIEAAFRKYIHRAEASQTEDSYEIIVCHANVIRYFVCRALQFPPEGWLRISLHNGSITWLTIRPSGRVSLRTLGDAGHMPVDKLSTT